MAAQGVIQDEIAKRYGGVLFDLAQKNKSTPKILKEVDILLMAIEDLGETWGFVTQPVVRKATQLQVIEKFKSSLKLSQYMVRFLDVMCHYRRLVFLKAILENYKKRYDASKGEVEGIVESPNELTQKQLIDLSKALKKEMSMDVILSQQVKPELMAGVVLRLGSYMVDASLQTKLAKLRQEMK